MLGAVSSSISMRSLPVVSAVTSGANCGDGSGVSPGLVSRLAGAIVFEMKSRELRSDGVEMDALGSLPIHTTTETAMNALASQ